MFKLQRESQRWFSSSSFSLAKSQVAIRRKKANIQRQIELKEQRSPKDFDPIIGIPTAFTRSLVSPTTSSQVQEGVYHSNKEIKEIQAAVLESERARAMADGRRNQVPAGFDVPNLSSTSNPDQSQKPFIPTTRTNSPEYDRTLLENRLKELEQVNERKSAASSRLLSLANQNARSMRYFNTQLALSTFGRAEGDTGSPEVQAAILTTRIHALKLHLDTGRNKRDVHGYRGFRSLVHKRQSILKYLRRESIERYFKCLEALGMTDSMVTREIIM